MINFRNEKAYLSLMENKEFSVATNGRYIPPEKVQYILPQLITGGDSSGISLAEELLEKTLNASEQALELKENFFRLALFGRIIPNSFRPKWIRYAVKINTPAEFSIVPVNSDFLSNYRRGRYRLRPGLYSRESYARCSTAKNHIVGYYFANDYETEELKWLQQYKNYSENLSITYENKMEMLHVIA